MSRLRNRAFRLGAVLSVVLTALAGMAGLTVASAAPAAAESSTTLTAQYPWAHNGCTGVSDNAPGASFTYACNHHDGCYGGHWADRATCDAWFRNDMFTACKGAPFMMITACDAQALLYYGAVRALGQRYYDSGGQQVRISTPMHNA